MDETKCDYCNKNFKRKYDLQRHLVICKSKPSQATSMFSCNQCALSFKRKDILQRHLKTTCKSLKRNSDSDGDAPCPKKKKVEPIVEKKTKFCDDCQDFFKDKTAHYNSNKHKDNVISKLDDYTEVIKTAFKLRVSTFRIKSETTQLTVNDFLEDVKARVIKLITKFVTMYSVKVNFLLTSKCRKLKTDSDDMSYDFNDLSIQTENVVIMTNNNISYVYDEEADKIKTRFDEMETKGSGWSVDEVSYLEVNINKYAVLKGSSYIATPACIVNKKAIINVKNKDDACFAWAIMSCLEPKKKNHDRTTSYSDFNKVLNFEGITFPMAFYNIELFEDQNDISVNVYGLDDTTVSGPLYKTKRQRTKHVNLLFLEEGDNYHYCWIKNLSALVANQINKGRRKNHFCNTCCNPFYSKDKLEQHNELGCMGIRSIMPTDENKIMTFKSVFRSIKVPVVVYADFECLLKPIETDDTEASNDVTKKTGTIKTAKHEPHSFGYYIKCAYDDNISKYVDYRGECCAEKFLNKLERDLKPYAKAVSRNKEIDLSPTEKEEFELSQQCYLCKKGFEKTNIKVKSHCHITGKYRGAAHNNCNLMCIKTKTVPIVMHNLSKYDSHFIISVLCPKRKVTQIIPKNKEHFISFSLKFEGLTLKFIDSLSFLASSLEKLAANIEKSQFKCLESEITSKNLPLLKQKGVFPYEYIDCMEKLNEKTLPPKEKFYSSLNKAGISNKKYNRAKMVWKKFGIKTLGEYSDLYLKTDVLLLADVFENFRSLCLKEYELDPVHYYTAPGLSWDAMMKLTQVELELLTDVNMLQMVKNGIRGGLSQCSGKHSVANNEYLQTSSYDNKQKSKYIIYLDANNLYGWAMSQPLPKGDFRWLEPEEISKLDIMGIQTDNCKGYILKVDLDYPEDLQNLHNDLPFCPHHKQSESEKKLIADLKDKKNYVIHYINLQQAMLHGLKLSKVHDVLEFTQSRWLERYIAKNTDLRSKATNAFDKEFYKLMNNSVFGKTMENVEKYTTVKIVNEWESEGKSLGARSLISKPNFHSCDIINENLIIVQMNKTSVTYNKPIFVGFAVLDISKTLMYNFHYDYMMQKFNKIKLLYTDTDSLIYEITDDDFYKDINNKKDSEHFDTSDYKKDNIFGLPLRNKKVIGKFKDECNGVIIKEFIGIRSKCYFVRKDCHDTTKDSDDDSDVEKEPQDETIKKIKGIKKSVVKNEISQSDFLSCLTNDKEKEVTMGFIRSNKHAVTSQSVRKIALKNKDDKRFAIPNSTDTLAWGHKDITKYENSQD